MTDSKATLEFSDYESSIPVRALRVEVLGEHARVIDAEDEQLTVGSAPGNDVVFDDDTVSRYHVEFLRTDEGVRVQDVGSTNGTWVAGVRLARGVVAPGTEVRVGRQRIRVLDGERVSVDLFRDDHLGPLRGSTEVMRRLFARVRKAASSNVPVLLMGESGTGKELIARALHDESDRAEGPFVTVDCASLSPTLVASELFGHVKGAFTGADRQHSGAFERADGGTLFLDEIGELPGELQPNLLGVLERRRFRRLGGRDEIDVDVRVVAATNRDLRAEVNEGAFRLDLYYRIAVVRLLVPPLRERRDDIPVLVQRFLEELGEEQSASDLLANASGVRNHAWPGNVRELRNFVEATVAMGELPPLEKADTSDEGEFGLAPSAFLDLSYKEARAVVLRHFERHYLPHVLERAGGNVSKAAREASIDRSHLGELLRKHGLK